MKPSYIGKRIESLRREQGFKKYIFHEHLGLSHTMYWKISTGRRIPDYLMLLKIAKALDVAIEYLVNGDSIDNYVEVEL